MTLYMAETDEQSVVVRVIVAPSPEWPGEHLGGTWVPTSDPYAQAGSLRYTGPGYFYDDVLGQFFPWSIDTATGTLWCLTSAWEAADPTTRAAFVELTGLAFVEEAHAGNRYVVFGGRVITDDDVLALSEALDGP